jgi:hypothetical protein
MKNQSIIYDFFKISKGSYAVNFNLIGAAFDLPRTFCLLFMLSNFLLLWPNFK